MGVKTLQIMIGLSAASILGSILVLFLPMHRLSFFAAGVFRAVRIDTHLLTAEFSENDSGFCSAINALVPGTCSDGSHPLQDLSQRFCAPLVKAAYPQGCDGFQNAFLLGVMLAISLLFNAIGLCTTVLALNNYIHGDKHKKSYRQMALVSLGVSTLQLAAAIGLYGMLVFQHLDEMRMRGGTLFVNMVFSASRGVGASHGFIVCGLIVLIQVFMLSIWKYTKTSEEQSDEEIKERKLFAAEAQANYGADGAPAPLAAPGQQQPSWWAPQQQQEATMAPFAVGGGMMQWASYAAPDPVSVAGGVQPAAAVYHPAVPSAYDYESQPAEMRRAQTYMPEAPPGSAV